MAVAVNGWYPDPEGTPGRYRYWDGNRWSAETTTDPRTPAPGSVTPPTAKINDRRRLLIGSVMTVLIIAVIVAVLSALIINSRRAALVNDPGRPESTASGWDDSSPLPTASPSQRPTAAGSSPQTEVACADADPYAVAPHPADNRIHGGSLSITQPGGAWKRDDRYARQMTWAYDVAGASEQVEPLWLAMLAVGSLHAEDGFHAPEQAAAGVLECIASSGYYQGWGFQARKDVFSRPTTVDGRRGWVVRSQILIDNPRIRASGDTVEVIVINTGTTGRLSFFAGFVPLGDQNRLRILDDTVAGMQVD